MIVKVGVAVRLAFCKNTSPCSNPSYQPEVVSLSQPFTASWIQALVKSASNPFARQVKPRLDMVNQLVRHSQAVEPEAAAKGLFEIASEQNLLDLLAIVPARQSDWLFPSNVDIVYHQSVPCEVSSLETWFGVLGLSSFPIDLEARVTQADWTTLVREAAVRQQKSFDFNAWGKNSNLKLPCKAEWREQAWHIQFATPDWLVMSYDESAEVNRPSPNNFDDLLLDIATRASKSVRATKRPAADAGNNDWFECVPSLSFLHEALQDDKNFPSQLRQVWNCVWPTVYREESVLRGKADLRWVQSEISYSLENEPSLTLWMFLFAKLVYQVHAGNGLGFLADFGR